MVVVRRVEIPSVEVASAAVEKMAEATAVVAVTVKGRMEDRQAVHIQRHRSTWWRRTVYWFLCSRSKIQWHHSTCTLGRSQLYTWACTELARRARRSSPLGAATSVLAANSPWLEQRNDRLSGRRPGSLVRPAPTARRGVRAAAPPARRAPPAARRRGEIPIPCTWRLVM